MNICVNLWRGPRFCRWALAFAGHVHHFCGSFVLRSSSCRVSFSIKHWQDCTDLEQAAQVAGLPMVVTQSEESWQTTPQGRHLGNLPFVPTRKTTDSRPKPLSSHPSRPLEGLKVLCLTHAIAGPSSGRTLAEYGASVLQIM